MDIFLITILFFESFLFLNETNFPDIISSFEKVIWNKSYNSDYWVSSEWPKWNPPIKMAWKKWQVWNGVKHGEQILVTQSTPVNMIDWILIHVFFVFYFDYGVLWLFFAIFQLKFQFNSVFVKVLKQLKVSTNLVNNNLMSVGFTTFLFWNFIRLIIFIKLFVVITVSWFKIPIIIQI